MITDLLVIAFVGLMALWFSNQGIFSALIHLIVTIAAGALAFAFWEPIALGYLINRMPEYAWGVGLLAPFALALIVLRTATDLLIPGNVNFHNIANMVGGGVLGAGAGLLAAGMLVIGLQFISGFSLPGYQPYEIQVNGDIVRTRHLILRADDFAGVVFTGLSGGSLRPTLDDQSVAVYQTDPVRMAGTYALTGREKARRTIRPANVEISRYFELEPKQLDEKLRPANNERAVILRTDIQLVGQGDIAGAADADGYFTASRAQVALIAVDNDDPQQATLIYPRGYVLNGEVYGDLMDAQTYAYSNPGVQREAFDWVFHVPLTHKPRFLRLKETRLDVPSQPNVASNDVEAWLTDVDWHPKPPGSDTVANGENGGPDMGPDTGASAGAEGVAIEVTDAMPLRLSKNWFTYAEYASDDPNALVRDDETIKIESRDINPNLQVRRIASPPTLKVVRVQMRPDVARSLYGKALQFAAQLGAPQLISDANRTYTAVGWIRVSGANVTVKVDTARPMQSSKEMELNKLADSDQLYLYFLVGKGVRITQFKLGNVDQDVNILVN